MTFTGYIIRHFIQKDNFSRIRNKILECLQWDAYGYQCNTSSCLVSSKLRLKSPGRPTNLKKNILKFTSYRQKMYVYIYPYDSVFVSHLSDVFHSSEEYFTHIKTPHCRCRPAKFDLYSALKDIEY